MELRCLTGRRAKTTPWSKAITKWMTQPASLAIRRRGVELPAHKSDLRPRRNSPTAACSASGGFGLSASSATLAGALIPSSLGLDVVASQAT